MKKDSQHYYTASPTSDLNKQVIDYIVGGQAFKLCTASGVFSKDRVDFGTRLLIDTLLDTNPNVGTLLDLGCGYGVIGTVLGTLLDCQVTLCDVNERALMLAEENTQRAGVQAQIIKSDGFESIRGSFDLIVTNPPVRAGKRAYYPWFDQSPQYLNPGGSFWCVLQKKQGAPSAKQKLLEAFNNCERINRDAGYHILMSEKI